MLISGKSLWAPLNASQSQDCLKIEVINGLTSAVHTLAQALAISKKPSRKFSHFYLTVLQSMTPKMMHHS